jgi:hypothetical protein
MSEWRFGDVARQTWTQAHKDCWRKLMFIGPFSSFSRDSGTWMIIDDGGADTVYPVGYIGSWPMSPHPSFDIQRVSDE